MSQESRPSVPYSEELTKFRSLRGVGTSKDETHPIPATPEQIAEAKRLTSLAISFLEDPALQPLVRHVPSLSWGWLRKGFITEEQLMEIVRTCERKNEGETAEDFFRRLDATEKEPIL